MEANGPNANSVSNDLWLDLLIRAQSQISADGG